MLSKHSNTTKCVIHTESTHKYTHTHTHLFNGPFSGTTRVGQYWSKRQWVVVASAGPLCKSAPRSSSTSPLSFLQAGCPFCHATNSIKVLKAIYIKYTTQQMTKHTHSVDTSSVKSPKAVLQRNQWTYNKWQIQSYFSRTQSKNRQTANKPYICFYDVKFSFFSSMLALVGDLPQSTSLK